ncbi:MAG: hypothetical protein PWR01_3631 [Clostridiales bacterium]|jgi:hypothetical protein|nr:hypothetical protein [Clostridiales bacterium]MDN5282558.1 hypothetical protein [Candidatus Ozemobacter sp.]
MIWFFAFTTIGIAIFALFLTLKRFAQLPFLKIIGGTFLMGVTGILAFKANQN